MNGKPAWRIILSHVLLLALVWCGPALAGKAPPAAAMDATLARAYLEKGDFSNARSNHLKALASPNKENFGRSTKTVGMYEEGGEDQPLRN